MKRLEIAQYIALGATCMTVLGFVINLATQSRWSMTLKAKNREYQAQETELKEQIQAEKDRSKEIKELDKYVGTDKYVEDVAKEKLGLVHNNEIIFKAK